MHQCVVTQCTRENTIHTHTHTQECMHQCVVTYQGEGCVLQFCNEHGVCVGQKIDIFPSQLNLSLSIEKQKKQDKRNLIILGQS